MKAKTAIKIMLWLVGAIVLFHLGIVIKIVPYEITWGGRLSNDTEMYVFESISIAMNLILMAALLVKGNYLRARIPMKLVNVVLWVFLLLFGLNTIGNILAKTNFEKCFAIITLAFTFLLWIILRKGEREKKEIPS